MNSLNDILSLKKDVQAAVDQTTDFLVANVKAFKETRQRLQKPEKGLNIEGTLN